MKVSNSVLIEWGFNANAANTTIWYPISFNVCYAVTVSLTNLYATVGLRSPVNFACHCHIDNTNIDWMAVGF